MFCAQLDRDKSVLHYRNVVRILASTHSRFATEYPTAGYSRLHEAPPDGFDSLTTQQKHFMGVVGNTLQPAFVEILNGFRHSYAPYIFQKLNQACYELVFYQYLGSRVVRPISSLFPQMPPPPYDDPSSPKDQVAFLLALRWSPLPTCTPVLPTFIILKFR